MNTKTCTQDDILKAGLDEFLSKGFRGASLRNIVKQAGVTTGAFYGYYKSKEELFDALVKEPYDTLMKEYLKAQQTFSDLPLNEQPEHMGEISGDCMDWMVDYIYEHFDSFRLLLMSAGGTKYENFIHRLVEVEVEATHQFLETLKKLEYTVNAIDPQLEHLLVSGMFSAFFELVIHDLPKQQAHTYVNELREFYTAGWMKIMGLSSS